MMPRSVSQDRKLVSARPLYRPVPYGAGTVRPRNGKWEARWTEDGVRRGKIFHVREDAEDFLLTLYRAEERELPDTRFTIYDGNLVYFVQAVDGGLIKIGHTSNPQKRLKDMQIGCPLVLRILGLTTGGRRREQELHKRFASCHVRDEWFKPSADLRRWIVCNAEEVDEDWARLSRK